MTPEAEQVYAAALARGCLVARDEAGRTVSLATDRWLGRAGSTDHRVLALARAPVLDVGCGPGRHVRALAGLGVAALGIDASPAAVRTAHRRGARVIACSVFGDVPFAGGWRTALLLDGSIGIGGDPVALLRRIAGLLAPDGVVLCELEGAEVGLRTGPLRLEHDAGASEWFAWARVGTGAIGDLAEQAGLTLRERWEDGGRWFARLDLA